MEIKTNFIFGYNQTMRSIPKGQLEIVLINAQTKPKLLIDSMIDLCTQQKIPCFIVDGLERAVHALKLCRVTAMALKQSPENDLLRKSIAECVGIAEVSANNENSSIS